MERFKSLIKRRGKRGEVRLNGVALAALSPLEGPFSHENYPETEISSCLEACRALTERRISSAAIRDLRRTVELLAPRHEALKNTLLEFNRRASDLRRDILALTAAARPLQEPGIALADVKARRAVLSERVAQLRKRRAAYEAEASALEARIQEMVLEVNALQSRAVALFGLEDARGERPHP